MKSVRDSICALQLNFDTAIQGQNENVILHGSAIQPTRIEHTRSKRKHFQHLKTLVHTFNSYEKVSKVQFSIDTPDCESIAELKSVNTLIMIKDAIGVLSDVISN